MSEAVIVSVARTPVGRAHKGAFKDMRADDLAAFAVKAVLERTPQLKVEDIEDVILGCAMPEGEQGLNVARIVAILAGLPDTVPGTTVNRFCASGLQAISMAANAIDAGQGDVFIAGGVESMSHIPMVGFNPSLNRRLVGGREKTGLAEAYISMGMTAENVAQKYKVSRTDMDQFAYRSHQNAIAAQRKNFFDWEIAPVTLADGTIVKQDEGPRADTTVEKLASLKPVFRQNGDVTAGNSSPLNDGAAAVVVMSRAKADALGLKPLARIVTAAVAGVEAEYMGIGPIPAVQKALKRAGMTIKDIDIVELNEAFASQSLVVMRELGIPEERLNPHGGGISIGHPLGCSGARIMTTLINDLRTLNKTIGLETMCVGGGQGMAMIIERLS